MSENSFWNTVEILRWVIIRIFLIVITLAIFLFCCREFVFDKIILSACNPNFYTYELLRKFAYWIGMPQIAPAMQEIKMININLASQLFTNISVSFYLALIFAFPYIVIEIWHFVAPALYKQEKKIAIKVIFSFVILFFVGILLSYYVIFPLTLNFLGTYQVSIKVENQISLNSYISSFLSLSFMLGLVFEIPIVTYFFTKIGVLKTSLLKRFRKYAFILVLILAAIITPSTDIFTMFLVAMPLQLLYESSIIVAKRTKPLSKDTEI